MALTTNYDIINCCREYHIPLIGVFSKDQLPGQIVPGGYVVNMQDSHDGNGKPLPGTHWVSFFIELNKKGVAHCCYYDPFGVVPPKSVQKLLKPLMPYPYCSFDIQNPESGVCGYYAVEFLWFMSKNRLKWPKLDDRFTHFLERYSYNPEKNLRLLEGFLKQIK